MRNISTARYRMALRRIKAAMKRKGLSQRQMASALGIPATRYWGMVNGETRIDMIEIAELMRVLDEPFEYFVPPRK